jgi:hypothetical protein
MKTVSVDYEWTFGVVVVAAVAAEGVRLDDE